MYITLHIYIFIIAGLMVHSNQTCVDLFYFIILFHFCFASCSFVLSFFYIYIQYIHQITGTMEMPSCRLVFNLIQSNKVGENLIKDYQINYSPCGNLTIQTLIIYMINN